MSEKKFNPDDYKYKAPPTGKGRKGYNQVGRKGMLPGNPGKPKGSKDKATLLKNKILEHCMRMDLTGWEYEYVRKNKKWKKRIKRRSIPDRHILTVGAGFVPKEIKGEIDGKPITINFPGFGKEKKKKKENDN